MDPVHEGCAHGGHLNNFLDDPTSCFAQHIWIEVDSDKDFLSNEDNVFVQRLQHDDSIREMRAHVAHLILYRSCYRGHVWIGCSLVYHEAIAPALDNYFRNDAYTNFVFWEGSGLEYEMSTHDAYSIGNFDILGSQCSFGYRK